MTAAWNREAALRVVRDLEHADEYEPLGHDGWTAAALLRAADAEVTRLRAREDAAAQMAEVDRLTGAARDVLGERQRQIGAEGWTPEHDDTHDHGELARAAACYAWVASLSDIGRAYYAIPDQWPSGPGAALWPAGWQKRWWKPSTPRRDLVKAGALILAEIERLDRAALASELGA